jgi:hypothetical protein
LQASKGCQNKEQILQQRFQKAFREFQQWLMNAKITTAKCFDVPQNMNEVSASLQKIQVRLLSIHSDTSAQMAYSMPLDLFISVLCIKILPNKFKFQINTP